MARVKAAGEEDLLGLHQLDLQAAATTADSSNSRPGVTTTTTSGASSRVSRANSSLALPEVGPRPSLWLAAHSSLRL